MIATLLHPATILLLGLQSRGRSRRIWSKFCQPRRLILSAIACLLTVVWLGNAVLTVWLREPASAAALRALLSSGLLLYALWHFTKAAFFRPESPFDWTPAEQDLLLAMPMRSRDLVTYQLASVTVTTLVKSSLFTLLMLPDLHCLPLGFAGLVLAMMTLEILRMAIEIATWGMSRREFLVYRAAVVAGLLLAGVSIGAAIVDGNPISGEMGPADGIRQRFVEVLVRLNDSALVYVGLPFWPLLDLILADALSWSQIGLAAAAGATVIAMAVGVVALYAATTRRMADREASDYAAAVVLGAEGSSLGARRPAGQVGVELRLRRILWLGGAGALVWRQLLGARRHWGSLLTAMIAPAVLASAPCFVIAEARVALLATSGTLAFYTFLLLPTALRFDFRRDLDRLASLKGLPITPAAAAVGQILAPVLIATVFQGGVLAFSVYWRSLPQELALVALLVLLPLNVLVFALDNLIFLLYPHRLQQEGLEIFMRTMLTFTGKGLLFGIALAGVSAWSFACAALPPLAWRFGSVTPVAVFIAGIITGLSLFAAITLLGVCRTYHRLDPIEDLPR